MKTEILDRNNLKFKKTIQSWYDGLLLGNGSLGTVIWGGGRELKFGLDRLDLWDITPCEGVMRDDFTWENLIHLVKEKNYEEREAVFTSIYRHSIPSKLPAGKLVFDFGSDCNVASEMVLRNATAMLQIGELVHIESIVHAKKDVGMIRIDRPMSAFKFCLENPGFGVEGVDLQVDGLSGPLKGILYPVPEVGSDGHKYWMFQKIGSGVVYGIFATAKEVGCSTQIAYTVGLSKDGDDWKECAWAAVEEAVKEGYEAHLKSHSAWWENYWNKSAVTLPDQLFEKNWYLAQYFFACNSKKDGYAIPLQGVWTEHTGVLAPCKGDYHWDLNMQMSYYAYAKANHLEEGEGLIDYLWKIADNARAFAKSFYHAKGLAIPATADIGGRPIGGWNGPAYGPTHQIWTCQILERHYRSSGDKELLRERIYPFIKETAEFILSILEVKDGKYYLPISTSPEIHDDANESFLTPNSNYDLSLMIYLFETLERLAKELGNGEEQQWKNERKKLPELAINEKGVLMLSPDEELKESHRHHSHTMPIHPLRQITYDNEEGCRIIDATVQNLEELGTGFWICFSYTWMAELYAIQKNGNGAAHNLEMFWRYNCSKNGLSLNHDFKKAGIASWHGLGYTMETNFAAASALQEMLLFSEENQLHLFPAIPEEWLEEALSFDTFRAEKGLLVSAAMEEGIVTSLTLQAEQTVTVQLVRDEKSASILDVMEKDGIMQKKEEDGKITVVLEAGTTVTYCL